MEVKLQKYNNEENIAIKLIKDFWLEHNNYVQTDEDAKKDLVCWTGKGHDLYFIVYEEQVVGFIHLGSRGALTDWLEDIYVERAYQNRGIGSEAIELTEQIVKSYSESMYIEAAARNIKAIELYYKLGYDCLNTVTIRKDFNKDDFNVISKQTILNMDFEVKKYKL